MYKTDSDIQPVKDIYKLVYQILDLYATHNLDHRYMQMILDYMKERFPEYNNRTKID